jgi:epoxide hydrolase-like predicted phosphatase
MALNSLSPIKAVLWDLGGVILRTEDWEPRERWEAELGLPNGELQKLVFEGELGKQAALGLSDADAIWRTVGEQLSLSEERLGRLREDFWSGDRIDDHLTAVIRGLRPDYLTGLLSNAWPDVHILLNAAWGLADAFDITVLSCEVGLAKPDPRIYHLALDKLGLEPEQVVFLDDFQRNVEGARQIGMQAIWFQDPNKAIVELDQYLGR